MNRVILVGRLTRDPNVSYSSGNEPMCSARYTLAVDRRGRRDNNGDQPTADFIDIVAFRHNGAIAEKYLRKGTKILVEGKIQTSNYTNKEGQKVYRTEVVVDSHEFVESKGSSQGSDQFVPAGGGASTGGASAGGDSGDGFMNIPDGIDEELPFS